MADFVCFDSFCEKSAEYQCNCSIPQTFWCGFHLINHLEALNTNHLVEAIAKNINLAIEVLPHHQIKDSRENHIEHSFQCPYEHPCECPYKPSNEHPTEYIYNHSSECPFNPFYEYPYKNTNKVIQSTLDSINSQKLAIKNIQNEFSDVSDLRITLFSDLIKDRLKSIGQYSELLDEIKIWAECAVSIDDIPLSLIEIMNISDNIAIQIEFLKILKETLWIKNQVKNYWLARLSENPEKTDWLKSEANMKIQDIYNWCFLHKNNKEYLKSIDDKKIDILSDELKLISELLNRRFEPKHIFEIREGKFVIYGIENRRWGSIVLSLDKSCIYAHNARVIELPNFKIFCLMGWESFTIDLKTLSMKKRFTMSSGYNYHSAPIYYENYVYIFSASIGSYFEKYNLISNKKSILPCPFMGFVSRILSCIYKNAILVWVEKAEKLYKFDPLIESYSEILLEGLYSKSVLMLFTWNMKVYIIDRIYGVFESGIDNEYIWNKIGVFESCYISKSDNLSRMDSPYFCNTEDNFLQVYQFDLRSKKIYKSYIDRHDSLEI